MRAAFLLRVLACVALVVSGLPIWAAVCKPSLTATPIASALAVAEGSPACAMACCKAEKVLPVASCCPEEEASNQRDQTSHGLAAMDAGHGCVVSVDAAPTLDVLAALPTAPFDEQIAFPVAVLPTLFADDLPVPLGRLRVGIAGLDAGPPQASPCLPDSGRSPPFSRA